MEFFGILILIGVVGFILAAPIVALVRAHSAARQGERNQESWQKLTQRVHALETQLQEIQGRLKAQTAVLEKALHELPTASTVRERPAPPDVVPPEPPKPAEVASGGPVSPLEPKHAPPIATPQTPAVTAPPMMKEAARPTTPPRFEQLGTAKPSPRETAKRVLNMEEVLGANWLNKLGMVILVIGVALFLAYEMRELGPAGKVLVGFVVSGALLGVGIFYESRERYRILARAAIGGGWALTFFTVYAMYHVEAARVLQSQVLDLVLLLGVAAVMVAHTLRYNSQVVTGLALLLAFVTVTISHVNVYSLSAGAILALALVIIVNRRGWFELEIFGILSSYLNHYYWLRHIIEPMGGQRHAFPEFYASATLLVFYWLLFRVSYLLRRTTAAATERVSTVAALLNTCLLLSVMKYQSVHPEWAFRFLLLLGAVEFTLGQLPSTRRHRPAFVVLSTIGATLLVAALPFKYSGATLPILWLAEAEALFLAGVFTREIVFRRLGLLASLLVAFQMDRLALGQILDPEWKGFQSGDWLRGVIVFSTTVLIFYIDAHWFPRRRPDLVQSRFEALSLRVLSCAAGATAFIGIWWLAPEAWAVVGFAALALALSVLGSRATNRDFLNQAIAVAILAFLRVLFVNLGQGSAHVHLGTRLVTVGLTAALLYASALVRPNSIHRVAKSFGGLYLGGLVPRGPARLVRTHARGCRRGMDAFGPGVIRNRPRPRLVLSTTPGVPGLRVQLPAPFLCEFQRCGIAGSTESAVLHNRAAGARFLLCVRRARYLK